MPSCAPLPSFLSLSPSVCVGRSSSEARCKQGQCGGSPDYRESLSLDEVSLSFPGVSEVDGPHQSRSNIRQKQRRPSLPCSYFPFLSTRRRRRRGAGAGGRLRARAAGRSLSEGKNTPKFRHGSSVILPPPSILKHGYDTTSSREYAMAKVQ